MKTITNKSNAAMESAAGNGVNITLSAEAQKLLADGNADASGQSGVSGVQKTGQNFLMSFFDQNGVDFEKLSPDALKLIQGLQDVIAGSGGTARDFATDMAEEKYAGGERKAYTLVGDGTRLRLAIQYKDGKPEKLSITDITGGQVETADITLGRENGKAATINIARTQREYVNGHMNTVSDMDPLSVDLYSA